MYTARYGSTLAAARASRGHLLCSGRTATGGRRVEGVHDRCPTPLSRMPSWTFPGANDIGVCTSSARLWPAPLPTMPAGLTRSRATSGTGQVSTARPSQKTWVVTYLGELPFGTMAVGKSLSQIPEPAPLWRIPTLFGIPRTLALARKLATVLVCSLRQKTVK